MKFLVVSLLLLQQLISSARCVAAMHLRAYLTRVRTALSTLGGSGCSIAVCLGNEAFDADSIISSLCMGYLRQSQLDRVQGGSGNKLYVPILMLTSEDLRLRRETELLLQQGAQLGLDELILFEECVSSHASFTSLVLCDHNELRCKKLPAEAVVEEIIDHHTDTKKHLDVPLNKRNIAFDESSQRALAGSCCSLVAELFAQDQVFGSELDASIASLLLGVITLDTLNMDEAAGKGTERDVGALEYLKRFSPLASNSQALFEQLRDCKTDPSFWNALGPLQCLRLDYKDFASGRVGVSSVLMPAFDFLNKEHCQDAVRHFLAPRASGGGGGEEEGATKMDALVVMILFTSPLSSSLQRELILFSSSPESLSSLASFISTSSEAERLNLQLADLNPGDEDLWRDVPDIFMRTFSQGQIKASRKQIAPLLEAYYAK